MSKSAVALLAAIALGAGACGSDGGSSGATTAAAPAETATPTAAATDRPLAHRDRVRPGHADRPGRSRDLQRRQRPRCQGRVRDPVGDAEDPHGGVPRARGVRLLHGGPRGRRVPGDLRPAVGHPRRAHGDRRGRRPAGADGRPGRPRRRDRGVRGLREPAGRPARRRHHRARHGRQGRRRRGRQGAVRAGAPAVGAHRAGGRALPRQRRRHRQPRRRLQRSGRPEVHGLPPHREGPVGGRQHQRARHLRRPAGDRRADAWPPTSARCRSPRTSW